MPKFAVILPAAGKSSRFSLNKRKKPFVELKGRAIWVRAAELFVNREDVAQTIIAVSPEDLDWFKEKFRPNLAFMDIEIAAGGAERADTVQNALGLVKSDVDFVAVHDAARPLLAKDWVDVLFREAQKSGAVIPALPIAGTIKRVGKNQMIEETVDRERLWEAQTPQIFRRELLLEAYAKRGELPAPHPFPHPFTDEAQLVEYLGQPVTVVRGWPMNFKITTMADFKMAEACVDALPKPKSLRGLHPFADEEPQFP